MNCETCKEKKAEPVPFAVYEGEAMRHQRTVKWLIIALVLAVVLIFASNGMWLWYLYQYDFSSETETTTVEFDTGDGGNANYIGQDGDIYNGENASD